MWLLLLGLLNAHAMPGTEYNQLSNSLENASFSPDKIQILNALPSNTSLTMSQGIGVLETFSFASDQLKALRTIAPYLLERDQQYLLLDMFTFSSDKQKASSILSQIEPSRQLEQEAAEEAKRVSVHVRKRNLKKKYAKSNSKRSA
jgi:hypothetical protein